MITIKCTYSDNKAKLQSNFENALIKMCCYSNNLVYNNEEFEIILDNGVDYLTLVHSYIDFDYKCGIIVEGRHVWYNKKVLDELGINYKL